MSIDLPPDNAPSCGQIYKQQMTASGGVTPTEKQFLGTLAQDQMKLNNDLASGASLDTIRDDIGTIQSYISTPQNESLVQNILSSLPEFDGQQGAAALEVFTQDCDQFQANPTLQGGQNVASSLSQLTDILDLDPGQTSNG